MASFETQAEALLQPLDFYHALAFMKFQVYQLGCSKGLQCCHDNIKQLAALCRYYCHHVLPQCRHRAELLQWQFEQRDTLLQVVCLLEKAFELVLQSSGQVVNVFEQSFQEAVEKLCYYFDVEVTDINLQVFFRDKLIPDVLYLANNCLPEATFGSRLAWAAKRCLDPNNHLPLPLVVSLVLKGVQGLSVFDLSDDELCIIRCAHFFFELHQQRLSQ